MPCVRSVGPQVTRALDESGVRADRIAAIGLTNQRETTIVWERATGKAIAPALVWQDRRTAPACDRLKDRQAWVSERTGLVIDPYFSATKIAWILDHVPGARRRAEAGELAAGTVDSFLVWHLTAGRRFVTDATNASRTLLMDLKTLRWADDLCDLFGVPPRILPEIRPSSGEFGQTSGLHFLPDGLPILGIAGDQQASLIGQGCVEAGQAKCTYGTGAFLLAHTGGRIVPSRNGLITTLAATLEGQPPQYALEGSVFVAGAAVQWFRDGLKAIGASYEINPLSLESDPAMDVVFVPALTGPGRPLLAAVSARDDLRPDARHVDRRPRPRHAGRRRLPGGRPDPGDERRTWDYRSPSSGPTAAWRAPTRSSSSRRTCSACRSAAVPQTESTAMGAALWPDSAPAYGPTSAPRSR